MPETASQKAKYAEYTGMFGERRLTAEGESLYLQRVSGPHGEGPKLKLTEISKDAFAVPESDEIRVKAVRGTDGKVIEIQVHAQSGEWEVSKRTN